MKLTIYGAGYVGLVTGACFAELGHNVCCVDIDNNKISALKKGKSPIYEENLETLLNKNLRENRLQFTHDFKVGVQHAALQMIAVGTPERSDGCADLQYVEAVATQIGSFKEDYFCVINKSTVPVGTAAHIQAVIRKQLKKRGLDLPFDVVSNPEFLREGQAIVDCMSPDRIIIGTESGKALALMQKLYQPITKKGHPLLVIDTASAELTKYTANAFLATKISFMNEISQIAERVGANIHAVKKGISMDSRIDEKFLNAGCGFGGSCFPKDVSALVKMSERSGYKPHILEAVLQTNAQQQALVFHKIEKYFKNNLKDKTIALWGLAFKPNTDDVRCASSRVLMEMLWDAGAKVRAYDPLAMENIRSEYTDQTNLALCESLYGALDGADALAVMTEWETFKAPEFKVIKQTLATPVIFDGRNVYQAKKVREMGLDYFGVGC